MSEHTRKLFDIFIGILGSKAFGDVTFDGAKVTHAYRQLHGGELFIIPEFQYSIDGEGNLLMQCVIHPDIHDMAVRKTYVGAIEKVISSCEGSEHWHEEFQMLTFGDGEINCQMETVHLGQEPDLRVAFIKCIKFEQKVADATAAMLKSAILAGEQALTKAIIKNFTGSGQPN